MGNPWTGEVQLVVDGHPRDLKLTRPLRESLKLSRQFVRRTLGY